MRLRIAIHHPSITLVMREFVSGPPRYHLAIKGVREKFVVFRTEFRTLHWGFEDLYHWTRKLPFWGYFFGRSSSTSLRRSATLVSAYRVLRIKLTCTLACSVYTVPHADGDLRQNLWLLYTQSMCMCILFSTNIKHRRLTKASLKLVQTWKNNPQKGSSRRVQW